MRVAFVMQSTQVRCSIEHVLEIYWCVRMKTWSNIVYVNGLSNVDRIVFVRLFFLINTSKRTFFSFEAKQFIFSELKWLKNCLTRDTVFVCFSSCFLKTTKCTTECWEERKMQKYKNNWFQIDSLNSKACLWNRKKNMWKDPILSIQYCSTNGLIWMAQANILSA